MIRARLLAATLVVATAGIIALPGAASAAPDTTYFGKVAAQLRSSGHHVYVDPAASSRVRLSSSQASSLEKQIKNTGKPLYVVIVADNEALTTSGSTELLTSLHNAFGQNGLGSSQAIGASFSKGFYADGFNLPAAVAQNAGPYAKTAVTSSGNNPAKAYSLWVQHLAAIKVGKNVPYAQSWPAKKGTPGWAIFLIVLGSLLVVAGIIVGIVWFVRRKRRNDEDELRNNRIHRDLEQVTNDLYNLQTEIDLQNGTGRSSQNAGLNAVQAAESALRDRDLDSAQSHVDDAKHALSNARAALNPQQQPASSAYSTTSGVPDDDELGVPFGNPVQVTSSGSHQQSNTGGAQPRAIRARTQNGQTVIVNQNTFPVQQSSSQSAPYYYGGGYWNGMYMPGGYYGDPFWNLMLTEAILDDRYNDQQAYNTGFLAGEQTDANNGNWGDNTTGTADGADWSDSDQSADPNNGSDGSWSGNDDQQVADGGTDGADWDSGSGDSSGVESSSDQSGGGFDSGSNDSSGYSSDSSGGYDSSSSYDNSSSSGFDSGGGYDSSSGFDSGSTDSGGGWS